MGHCKSGKNTENPDAIHYLNRRESADDKSCKREGLREMAARTARVVMVVAELCVLRRSALRNKHGVVRKSILPSV